VSAVPATTAAPADAPYAGHAEALPPVAAAAAPAELINALFATEIGTSRQPETVAAMFDRLQALTTAARR
jgi:hypothetical protein